MKKIFTFVMLLTMGIVAAQAECKDGPYGLQINGKDVVDAPKFGDPDIQGRVQYKAGCVDLKVGDEIKLINQSCDATWMVDLDPYGEYQSFEGGSTAGKLTCKKAGKYDFYIKLSGEVGDILYVGAGEDCDGTNPGGGGTNPGGTVEGNPRYYYKLYTPADEKWYEPSEATLFDHGVAEVVDYVGDEAYVFILFQVDNQDGAQYFTKEYVAETSNQATFYPQAQAPKCEKWRLPAGATNLYLYDNGDGSLTMSVEPIPGKKLADPQPAQGIEETASKEKAHKVFIDGQLRIVRGDKMFDATGRQL